MRKIILEIVVSFIVMISVFCVPTAVFGADGGLTILYDQIILTNEAAEEITPYNLVKSKIINVNIPVYSESCTDGVFAAVVLYDRDGKMINAATENKNVTEGFSTIALTLNLDKAPQIGDDLKVYVWGNDYVDISSSVKGVQTVFIKGTSGNGIADIDFFELINEGEGDSGDVTNSYVNSTDTDLCSDMSVVSAQDFLNEDLHIGTKDGAMLEYDFVGKGIDVIARVSPNGGKIKIMIDGELETVVDAYNSQSKQEVIYTAGGMQGNKHRIRLEKLGGNEMAIDGFKVYGGDIKIACIGDSTTNSTTLPATDYYPQQLDTMLGEGFEVANFGRHSTTVMSKTASIPYINTEEYKNSLAFLPDVVVIMLGTNDSLPNRWVDKQYFVESYKSIIEEYKNLSSKPRVYISTSPTVQPNETWGHPDSVISGEMKNMIIQAAKETGCEIIDINAATKNVPDFFYDGLHPNKMGCELFAKEVFKKLPVKQNTDTLSIEQVKGGKDAICTIMSDDGYWVSSQFFNEAFKEYGFRGTIAYVADYTAATEGQGKYGTVEQWRKLLAEGYLDIANHSKSHSGHLTRSWNASLSDTEYEELLETEINGARNVLRNMFPEQKVLGYVLPFNAYDANVIAKTKEDHYAIRGGGSSSNSIDPTEDELFAVKSYDCNGEVPVDTMNGWVDSAIADGRWIVEMWHGIEGDHIYNPPSKEHVKAHLNHVKSKEESLWIATYTEAIQYIRERQTSRLIVLEENASEIRFILSDTMDNELFDYPLTVRVNVPYSWSSAEVSQNGVFEVCTITKDGTDAYLLIEVVPSEKVVTVAKK